MNRSLTWFTEYGHFFPGEFLRHSTPGRNINLDGVVEHKILSRSRQRTEWCPALTHMRPDSGQRFTPPLYSIGSFEQTVAVGVHLAPKIKGFVPVFGGLRTVRAIESSRLRV